MHRSGAEQLPLTITAVAALIACSAAANAQGIPSLSERLRSERWQNLSIRFPPSILNISRGDYIEDVLTSRDGEFQVVMDGDEGGDKTPWEIAVGWLGNDLLGGDLDVGTYKDVVLNIRAYSNPSRTDRAFISGLAGDRTFYCLVIASCPTDVCEHPALSEFSFIYSSVGREFYDRLAKAMMATITHGTGPAQPPR